MRDLSAYFMRSKVLAIVDWQIESNSDPWWKVDFFNFYAESEDFVVSDIYLA